MKRNYVLSLGLLAGLTIVFAGSASAGDEVREEFHETYKLAANGSIRLENINGDVSIKAWDRHEVRVDAIKTASSERSLRGTRIAVDAEDDEIRIETEHPGENSSWWDRLTLEPGRVDYTLTVPRDARLREIELVNGRLAVEGVEGSVKATTINGRLDARGLIADADLSTVNGSMVVSFARLDHAQHVSLESVNGEIEVTLPPAADADVSASTVSGRITTDFSLRIDRGRWVGEALDGTIGGGDARLRVQTVNGRISILKSK
ncbi:MAG: DUF4097 family beta strand repeat-containing protein [Acidobacteriota bacterium]